MELHTHEKRWYGCEEITIGFVNNGHGNEQVDFMSMDYKGLIRCYEIKVTYQDLKSKAKKSFYGHYNFLVITSELFQYLTNKYDNQVPWTDYGIVEDVGLYLCSPSQKKTWRITNQLPAKKRKLTLETADMLKESLVRSMYYKMEKYKNAENLALVKSHSLICLNV